MTAKKSKPYFIALVATLLLCVPVIQAQATQESYTFFRSFAGLDEDQIAAVRSGKPVARVVESYTPDEVFVFGAVYVEAEPESYVKLATNIEALRKLPSYVAVQSFSDPPLLTDLASFALTQQDINELKDCKPGHCEFQLPSEAIEEFQRTIDWSAPDVLDKANRLAQRMALQALLNYKQGGNRALGAYEDKNHPAEVAATFASLIGGWSALPVYLPDLNGYLLEYPNAKSDNIQSAFYWEKVNFGLKPTFRIVQKILYRNQDPNNPVYAVADKQIYASHYFQTALDLTVCLKDPQRPGFYLITIKGSKQAGLTGFKGHILRTVAVNKTRSALERVLVSTKQKLEAGQQ